MPKLREVRSRVAKLFLSSLGMQKNTYTENSAFLDVDILIQFLLKKERPWILSHPEFDFSEYEAVLNELAVKRCTGFPIAYLINEKDFYGRKFYVDTSTLIPKPDTEVLIENAIIYLEKKLKNLQCEDYSSKNNLFILDMCTGSGCIGISIACELELLLNKKFKNKNEEKKAFLKNNFSLTLIDISKNALDVCKKNVELLLSDSIKAHTTIIRSDLRDMFPLSKNNKYTLITANPPYIPSEISMELLLDGRNEPMIALDGGIDGLDLIKPLSKNAFDALSLNGKIFIEIGEYHSNQALEIFKQDGFKNTKILKDLSDADRIIVAER